MQFTAYSGLLHKLPSLRVMKLETSVKNTAQGPREDNQRFHITILVMSCSFRNGSFDKIVKEFENVILVDIVLVWPKL